MALVRRLGGVRGPCNANAWVLALASWLFLIASCRPRPTPQSRMRFARHFSAWTPAVAMALQAALLFGASPPLAKRLLSSMGPWSLAALLYAGCGLGLAAWRFWQGFATGGIRRFAWPASPRMNRPAQWRALGVVIGLGGVLGPYCLLHGLRLSSASSAALLLNAEGLFTAALAWGVFGEHVPRRIALGLALILCGAIILSWPARGLAPSWQSLWSMGSCWILAACLCWAADNNWMRALADFDASWIAMLKGLCAALVNGMLASSLGEPMPAAAKLLAGLALGLLCNGLSLVLYVRALRQLGAARTGAYFAVAPFWGACLALALWHESPSVTLLVSGTLMGMGVYLHLSESHAHEHEHEPLSHEHEHSHDDGHHDHHHEPPLLAPKRHRHWHTHVPMRHSHPHLPDLHHGHEHGPS